VLYSEITAAGSQIYTKPTNAVCWRNVGFVFNVKPGGVCSNY